MSNECIDRSSFDSQNTSVNINYDPSTERQCLLRQLPTRMICLILLHTNCIGNVDNVVGDGDITSRL